MKSEEEQILVVNKTNEGKNLDKAYKEIKVLKESQIKFKNQNRMIKTKTTEVEKLNKIIEDLKKKNFNLNLKVNSFYKEEREKKIDKGNGNLVYINRMMLILQDETTPLTISDLSKACGTLPNYLYPCISFMEKHNMIEEVNEHGTTKYSIKMKGGKEK